MFKSTQAFTIFSSLLSITLLGASCSSLNFISQSANSNPINSNNTNQAKLTEIDYYNLVIDNLNTLDQGLMQVQQSSAQLANQEPYPAHNLEPGYVAAYSALITQQPQMQNAEAQKQLQAKLVPFLSNYKTLMATDQQLASLHNDIAQTQIVAKTLNNQLAVLTTEQDEVFLLLKTEQDKIQLNIDPNTTQPLEYISLTQHILTADVDELFQQYDTWYQASSKYDFTALQTATAKLTDDNEKYQSRAASLNVVNVPFAGQAFTDYSSKVAVFQKLFIDFLQAEKSGAAPDLTKLNQQIIIAYNAVIDAHNTLAQNLQTQANIMQ